MSCILTGGMKVLGISSLLFTDYRTGCIIKVLLVSAVLTAAGHLVTCGLVLEHRFFQVLGFMAYAVVCLCLTKHQPPVTNRSRDQENDFYEQFNPEPPDQPRYVLHDPRVCPAA
ncbi:unnamed protein product [Clavelina lepadiformis]